MVRRVTEANSTARVLRAIAHRPLPCKIVGDKLGLARKTVESCVRELKVRGWARVDRVETGTVYRRGQRMGRREWVVATDAGRAILATDPDLRCLDSRAALFTPDGWPAQRDAVKAADLYRGRAYEDDPRALARPWWKPR